MFTFPESPKIWKPAPALRKTGLRDYGKPESTADPTGDAPPAGRIWKKPAIKNLSLR
jgi:hypothetical protein